jgi:hypothetical protein
MTKATTIVPCLFALVIAAGCASTQVTNRQQLVSGQLGAQIASQLVPVLGCHLTE